MLEPCLLSQELMIDSHAMAPHISSSDTTIPMTRQEKSIYHHHHSAALTMMMIKEALQKQEKHIAVDPVSLKQQESGANNNNNNIGAPPLLEPPKCKFLSMSQPNSPRLPSILSNNNNNNRSPPQSCLHKSKSCGEGRARPPPSDDIDDLWTVIIKNDSPNHNHHHRHRQGNDDYCSTKPEGVKEGPKRSGVMTTGNNMDADADAPAGKGIFRCGCLYIPGFYGKAKTVRPKREGGSNSSSSTDDGGGVVISRTVSMEKFDCGSWAPPSDQVEGNDSVSSYFDLPSELIRCGDEAFVIDNVRGVLKKNGRKSDASPRHVRFSTSPSSPASSSTCITPRLRKARAEFNAFLEAQPHTTP